MKLYCSLLPKIWFLFGISSSDYDFPKIKGSLFSKFGMGDPFYKRKLSILDLGPQNKKVAPVIEELGEDDRQPDDEDEEDYNDEDEEWSEFEKDVIRPRKVPDRYADSVKSKRLMQYRMTSNRS